MRKILVIVALIVGVLSILATGKAVHASGSSSGSSNSSNSNSGSGSGSKNSASTPGGIQSGIDAARDAHGGSGDLVGFFKKIVNTFLFLIGAISVVMIIYAGFQYVNSGGDSGKVSAAKNTILYAVIGIVVATLAYAIVNFVVNNIK